MHMFGVNGKCKGERVTSTGFTNSALVEIAIFIQLIDNGKDETINLPTPVVLVLSFTPPTPKF